MKKIITAIKIISLFIFNILIFTITNPYLMTEILFILILLSIRLKFPLYTRLKTIVPAAIFILLFQIFFNTSLPLNERFTLGYLAALNLTSISISVLLFFTHTSLYELINVFNFLPKKILLLLTLTAYFIPRVLYEADIIRTVQKSRGLNINNWNIIQNLASQIIPLMHRVFQRAETLSYTLLTRGNEE